MLNEQAYNAAKNDFHHARDRAKLKELFNQLRGESTQLLSFDEVRRTLKASAGVERGLVDIPLDSIVGSVGRYNDFTRDFMPRLESNVERWARVKAAATSETGLPPIEVYQIGEVYFVKDGNHRVSVARRMGSSHIQAYVTKVNSRVPLEPDIEPDDLILKAEYTSFLEHTQLDITRPDSDLSVSLPGQYQIILEHIDVHRYYMGMKEKSDIPYEQAVTHWYDEVYCPVIDIIRSLGILMNFPGRTETDLYVWIAKHRARIEDEVGWEVQTEYAVSDLATHHSERAQGLISRIGSRLLDIALPETLEGGPSAGEWRRQALAARSADRLFVETLVPINGLEEGWNALNQAIVLAKRENASLKGLHVVATPEEGESEAASALMGEFTRRCEQAGVHGELLVSSGSVPNQVCKHALWSDIIVLNLAHPPGEQALARLGSGFRQVIQRCPRPLLAAPNRFTALDHALLAFDGSSKALEGLYIGAYLAGKWGIDLAVVSVSDQGGQAEDTLETARDYLDNLGISAQYIVERGPVAEAILHTSESLGSDFTIMGGYGLSPVLEVVLGSTVDEVLRRSEDPVLICR